jgi:hypothetical protein
MALQTSVVTAAPVAVPGMAATPDQSIYTPLNYLADASGVVAGTFVWLDSDGNLTNTQDSDGADPVGLVERVLNYPIYNVTADGSNTVPAAYPVTCAVKGDYYVVTATAATVGQKVFAMTDGTIKTDDSGATVTGGIETSWVVKTAGDADGIILISNWA